MPELFVSFHRPRYGNSLHWAIYISGNEPMRFEVEGEHPNFARNVILENPESAADFLRNEYIGVISRADVEIVKEVASANYVDNETLEWDCQDYVLEILDELVEQLVLSEEDEDYCEARSFLDDQRGSIF